MPDLVYQILGLGILFGGVLWGWRRWIKPHAQLPWLAKAFLALIILTLMGGFIGSPFWWLDVQQSFSWDLPPLAARMLASAGWSFAVMCFLALERPTTPRLRLVLLVLFVYLAPLVAVILLFHLNRFDFAAPITYAFFMIAGGMSLVALGYLLRQPVILPSETRDAAPLATGPRAWMASVAVIMGLWGLALFIRDHGPLIWVWPGDLLTSRLIGTMLLAIAAGAAFALRYADTARLLSSLTLTYGIGVVLANLWSVLAGKPIQLSYLIAFSLLGLGSAILLRQKTTSASL